MKVKDTILSALNGSPKLPTMANPDNVNRNKTQQLYYNDRTEKMVGYGQAMKLKQKGHNLFLLKVNGGMQDHLPGSDIRVTRSKNGTITVGSQAEYEKMMLGGVGEVPNGQVKNRSVSGPEYFNTQVEYDQWAIDHGHPDSAHLEAFDRRHHMKNTQDLLDEMSAEELRKLNEEQLTEEQLECDAAEHYMDGKQMELFDTHKAQRDAGVEAYHENKGRESAEERLAKVTVSQATDIAELQDSLKEKEAELQETAKQLGRLERELVEMGCVAGELNNRLKSCHRIFFHTTTEDDLPF